jgi:predicted AlkP superfamily phosphohydrolase/phosphomutase
MASMVFGRRTSALEAQLLAAYKLVDESLAEIAQKADLDSPEICWLINSDHGAYLRWPDQLIKGGHDPSGFYCFTCEGLFRVNVTRTLKIEDLMPIILHLYGIDPFAELKGVLVDGILLESLDDPAIMDRLVALGYL